MYNYTLCGLDNVWLENGYSFHQTPYGEGVKIEDADRLDFSIGLALVEKPSPLTGKEFKFLRQQLGMSQRDLGRFIGVEDQTVARWEKGDGPAVSGDKLVRLLFSEHESGNLTVRDMVAKLNFVDRVCNDRRIVLEHSDTWHFTVESC
ncbi:MAG: helix-turn-helix domain-containing protein [Laribacter sp.]|nr:helix-turn-helix domain-containing protein [Laribacter sp.]